MQESVCFFHIVYHPCLWAHLCQWLFPCDGHGLNLFAFLFFLIYNDIYGRIDTMDIALKQTKLTEMTGKDLYYAFLAGSSKILKQQALMNKINVFPVPDGDTGSNLASTVQGVIREITPDQSFKKTADSIASAALVGARGNSGIIFAQFLYGLSEKIPKGQKINVRRFALAVRSALQYAVNAIEKPVEGTIITVIRDWVEYVDGAKERIDDFFQLMTESFKKAQKSLLETPQKLEILKKHNVVDAGGQGFVFFLEGILDFLKEQDLRKILRFRSTNVEPVNESHVLEEIRFRYCTEALIEGKGLDKEIVRERLGNIGDSLVIAGSGEKMRIHVHSNEPAEVLFCLKDLGEIPFQKVDDMQRQYETANQRKWNIALVTDSVCDLPLKVMDHFQVHMVPINLHFGTNTYLDKRSVTPAQFYKMLDKESNVPTTSQAGQLEFTGLYRHLAAHYDSVIAIHLAKRLSGTCNASQKAAEAVQQETGKKITVIDSRHLSGSLGLIVLRTAEAIAAGLDHAEIIRQVKLWREKTSILVSVKTMKYMVRGGRVSPMKGLLANTLNLKPIVSLDPEGNSILYDKAFSQKGILKKVMKILEKRTLGKTVRAYSVLHAHDPGGAARYAQQLSRMLNKKPEFLIDISPVVGVNAGQGALAVSLMLE